MNDYNIKNRSWNGNIQTLIMSRLLSKEEISLLIDDYHQGYQTLRVIKRKRSIKFLLKNSFNFVFRLFMRKSVECQHDNSFSFRLNSQLQQISGLPKIVFDFNSSESDVDLSIEYYLLTIAYLLNPSLISILLFKYVIGRLRKIFDSGPIEIFCLSPSLLLPALAYHCETNKGSKLHFIQHAVYQSVHSLYNFQKMFPSNINWLWSQNTIDNQKQRGVLSTQLISNFKIHRLKEEYSLNWNEPVDLVIIGESSEKFYIGYNKAFRDAIEHSVKAMKAVYQFRTIYFKPHPSSKSMNYWREICKENDWVFSKMAVNVENKIIIGIFSSVLLESLAGGFITVQVHSNDVKRLVNYDDYSKYSSIVKFDCDESRSLNYYSQNVIQDIKNESYKAPRIDNDYLLIDPEYIKAYRELFKVN